MAVLCPVHHKQFVPIEQKFFDIKKSLGLRLVTVRIIQITKSKCPEEGCPEVVFSDQYGVVIDGVNKFPKEAYDG